MRTMRWRTHPRYDFCTVGNTERVQKYRISFHRGASSILVYGAVIGRCARVGAVPQAEGGLPRTFHSHGKQQPSSPAGRVSTCDLRFLASPSVAPSVLTYSVPTQGTPHPVFCVHAPPSTFKPQRSVPDLAFRLHSRRRLLRHSLCACFSLGLRRR